ncbi:hypothetical protein V8E53_001423 [Lactarius tabidus]
MPILSPAPPQAIAANCTDYSLIWSLNSLLQSPCMVAAYLQTECSGGIFTVGNLPPGSEYGGPNLGQGNQCICNTVVYSLISACAACQKGSWINYSTWLSNCTSKATPGVFPMPIPVETRVPKWAYLDSFMDSNSWNLTTAEAVGDYPEVTGSFTSSPLASPLASPTTSGSGSSPTSTSHSSSNRGRISVTSGIIGAILISGVVAWFVVRRQRARCAPPKTDTRGKIEQPVPNPLTVETPRIYDPSDPTTYPRRELQPQRFGSTSYLSPSQLGYNGLPEI